MQQITVKVPDDTAESLANVAESQYDDNRSKAIRELLQRGINAADIERENDRLRAEKRTLINQREEHGELVEYVAEERTMQQRREERRDAPLWTRARWLVFGRDRD
jgi:metal-responsive CopG/Arc/MetJ family transcriptional regulator